jgi:hypothetical protein
VHHTGDEALLGSTTTRIHNAQPTHISFLSLIVHRVRAVATALLVSLQVVPPLFHPLVWPIYALDAALRYLPLPLAHPVHLPTFIARLLMFKFSIDTLKLPAVGDLLRLLARWVV